MDTVFKVIIPVIITLTFSALGTFTFSAYQQLQLIENRQIDSNKYVVKIEYISNQLKDHEQRIRILEAMRKSCL